MPPTRSFSVTAAVVFKFMKTAEQTYHDGLLRALAQCFDYEFAWAQETLLQLGPVVKELGPERMRGWREVVLQCEARIERDAK
jgi:hypothetical protein